MRKGLPFVANLVDALVLSVGVNTGVTLMMGVDPTKSKTIFAYL